MTQSGGASSGVLIFPAGPADAEDLARVHVAAWRETYRGLLSDSYLAGMSEARHARTFAYGLRRAGPDEVTLIAGDRQGAVGYAAGGRSRSRVAGEGEIATLYLLRRAQGRGVGSALMRGAARALAAQGATSLAVSVLRDNLRAREFYEHLGGVSEPARREPGPGGQLLYEVTYRWADIGALLR